MIAINKKSSILITINKRQKAKSQASKHLVVCYFLVAGIFTDITSQVLSQVLSHRYYHRYYHTLPGAAMVHTGHTGAVVNVSLSTKSTIHINVDST